jgi:hypothetical protein
MRPSRVALTAAVVVGCAGWATASPLIPSLSQDTLEAHRGVELVRRHHRGRGWGHWGYQRFGRDLGDDRGMAETVGRGSPEAIRPDRRRRGGWVDPPRGF